MSLIFHGNFLHTALTCTVNVERWTQLFVAIHVELENIWKLMLLNQKTFAIVLTPSSK